MVVKYRFRLYLFTLVILLGFGALAQRLWNLSVESYPEYKDKVPGTKTLRARVPGVRGEIKDRNGFTIVSNKPSFEVRVNLKTLVDEYRKQLAEENKHLPAGKKRSLPVYKSKLRLRGIDREKEELDINAIFEEVIISSLSQLGLSKDYNADSLRIHYRTHRGVVPWVYCSDLTFEEFSQFAEHRLGLPGISVTVRPVRQYLFDSLACHVVGYVSQPDEQMVEAQEKKEWDFYVPDDYGVAGVEQAFDAELRGRPGVQTMLQNEKGRIVRELDFIEPRKGHDVYLTLDARIQYIAERALRESTPAIGRGAVVVLQPSTGEVLAMASVPSYNPNKFIPSISRKDFQEYLDNPAVPLLNRAVRAYAPGSTYKVMIGFAGILAGIENDRWNCSGGVTYGNKYMKCWIAEKGGSHGTLNLSDAIMRSCNCYFYQYGNHAGVTNIGKAGQMFGLGAHTGIELKEEVEGILPNAAWIKAHEPNLRPDSPGITANTSIGQGFVLATPLQLAGIAAATGNGGIAYKPHLLSKVMDGTELVRQQAPEVRANFADFGLTPQKLELVRKGMWKVVQGDAGTAKAARIENVEVAGKTGTAQNWLDGKKDNHTLFITFAPYNNPELACCIIVQGGKSGGGCAAPIAKRIMEQALALKSGYTVNPVAVAEVAGNFNHVDSVSYDGLAKVSIPSGDEDTGTADDEEPVYKPRVRQREAATPRPRVRVREEADAEGRAAAANNRQPPPRRAGLLQRIFRRGGNQ